MADYTIDTLRKENERLRKQASAHEQVTIERFLTRTGQYITNDRMREAAIEAGRAELRARLAEAQRDAERYRQGKRRAAPRN